MPYCTQADIEDLLSSEGVVLSSADDREATEADEIAVANSIERAGTKFEFYALKHYERNDLVSNAWAKWCVATLAAVELMKRRGNVVPGSLEESAKQYLEDLKAVAAGEAIIPSASPMAEPGLTMTNLTHDLRFRQAKIRVLPYLSAGRNVSEKPRRVDIGPRIHER